MDERWQTADARHREDIQRMDADRRDDWKRMDEKWERLFEKLADRKF
jgi:hypothetical protein